MEQSFPDAKVLQETVISGGRQIVYIVQRIVRNQVMMCILYLDAYRSFNQSIFFEIIRVHQGTNERTIGVIICICSVYPCTPPCSVPLLGSESAAELAIKKKIGQRSTWTPPLAVYPSLDTRSRFVVHKYVATGNKLRQFSLCRTTEAVAKISSKAGFKNDQRVSCGLNPSLPRRRT